MVCITMGVKVDIKVSVNELIKSWKYRFKIMVIKSEVTHLNKQGNKPNVTFAGKTTLSTHLIL